MTWYTLRWKLQHPRRWWQIRRVQRDLAVASGRPLPTPAPDERPRRV